MYKVWRWCPWLALLACANSSDSSLSLRPVDDQAVAEEVLAELAAPLGRLGADARQAFQQHYPAGPPLGASALALDCPNGGQMVVNATPRAGGYDFTGAATFTTCGMGRVTVDGTFTIGVTRRSPTRTETDAMGTLAVRLGTSRWTVAFGGLHVVLESGAACAAATVEVGGAPIALHLEGNGCGGDAGPGTADAGIAHDAPALDGQPADARLVDAAPAAPNCFLRLPASVVATAGQATAALGGRIYAAGITDPAGAAARIRGQLGYGPIGTAPAAPGWQWVASAFHRDAAAADGVVGDEHEATLTIDAEGSYEIAYRFSLDDGQTWMYCDGDGSSNGYASSQSGRLVVTSAPETLVDFCRFDGFAQRSAVPGERISGLLGQVYAAGVTPGAGSGAGIQGELGFGPIGSAVTGADWHWLPASYLKDGDGLSPGDLANDEYTADLIAPPAGSHALAFRFRRGPTGPYSYCDRDGSANGFDLAQAGQLVTAPLSVGFCAVTGPSVVAIGAGATLTVRGRLFVSGRTNGAGAGGDIQVQVGFGESSAEPADWTWRSAAYAGDVDGLAAGDLANDEYAATIAPPKGSYRVAYRATVDGGAHYTLCDLGVGSTDGFAVADAMQLGVGAAIGSCALSSGTVYATQGLPSPPIVARVELPGNTEAVGPGPGVRGQVGYGPLGSAPTAAGWSWADATYAGDSGAADEYRAALTVGSAGDYATAYRFSSDGGATWTLCDRDGSVNGFANEQAGLLGVRAVDWCRVEGASPRSAGLGMATSVSGQIFLAQVTPGRGQGAGLRVELGLGPADSPVTSSAWAWSSTHYASDSDGPFLGDLANDVYEGSFMPKNAGRYAFAYRASRDDGASWSYCDLGGSDDGFSLGDAGVLMVATPAIGYCAIDRPAAATVETGMPATFLGRVFAAGITPGDGVGAGLMAELGYGAADADPATWTWTSATYAGDVDGLSPGDHANDAYQASISPPIGRYAVAYRFSADGGQTVSYCDLGPNGSTDGFSTAAAAALTVTPAGVGWCRFEGPSPVVIGGGASTPELRGRVYLASATPGSGRAPGIRGQLGYGPRVDAPDGPSWTWTDAAYRGDVDGLAGGDLANDEYGATLAPPPGEYAVAFRFSTDDGVAWSYCDRDGLDNGFDLEEAGALSVNALAVGWCELESPARVVYAHGGPVTFRGRVFVDGRTPGVGAGADIGVELGYGPADADPMMWTWSAASYAADADGLVPGDLANDEYVGAVTPSQGTYRAAFRVTVNSGQSFTLCDRAPGSTDGFSNADAAELEVAPPVGWCELHGPENVQVTAGQTTPPVTGRLYVEARTTGVGPARGVLAELGYGIATTEPSSWSWSTASYRGDVDGFMSGDLANDEFAATLALDVAGSYAMAFRFSTDDGRSWTFCDAGPGGSSDGFMSPGDLEIVP